MSQQKAQLINATENVTLSGGLDVSGITTAGNFIGSFSGTATGLSGTPNITLGIVTATLYGDGSNLDNVGSPTWNTQSTTSISGTTTIDLSAGNVIYFTHNTDTTVAFANTESVQKVQFIRKKDETTTARSITWPTSIIWNSGTEPTLIDSNSPDAIQVFNLTTRDQGVSWYGYESLQNDPADVATAGTLYSWGRNDYGQVGNNTRQAYPNGISSPAQIPGNQWLEISRGRNRGFGIKTGGTLWAWGENTQGRLGLNNEIHYSSPTQVSGTAWNVISNGYHSTYAIKTDGTLWAWGRADDAGELAQGDRISRSSPTQIPGTQWTVVSGGEYYASAIKSDGTLWTFGYNQQGQLGLNSRVSYSSPVQIPGTWSKIDNSRYHQMAQKTDGTLWTWGNNGNGLLAQNNVVNYSSPVQLPGTQWSDFVSNATSGPAFASKTDGTLWMWGENTNGQLAQNDNAQRSSPVQLPGNWVMPDRNSYDTGSSMMGLTKTDGTFWVWGRNYVGGFGLNGTVATNIAYSSPMQLPGTTWTKVGNYGYQTLAKQSFTGPTYAFYSAGMNSYGQLGQNDTTHRSSPIQIPGTGWDLTAFEETQGFSSGDVTVRVYDGQLWVWGKNGDGELGLNDIAPRSSPVQLPGTEWKNAFGGQFGGFATKTDGTGWAWGQGGNMPLNDLVPRSSPTQIPGNWTKIKATVQRNGGYGFKSDGTAWAWGYGSFGSLADNSNIPKSSPVQIPGTQWSFISANNYTAGGIKTDGTLWVWGYNNYGQDGVQAGVLRSEPIQIPGTNWSSISASYSMLATKTDGTLWAWGYNNTGQLGLSNTVDRSSPTQIPGTDWNTGQPKSHLAQYAAGAIKTDGTLWVWGQQSGYGRLGLNDLIEYSSPRQLPGTQWVAFNIGMSKADYIKSNT